MFKKGRKTSGKDGHTEPHYDEHNGYCMCMCSACFTYTPKRRCLCAACKCHTQVTR